MDVPVVYCFAAELSTNTMKYFTNLKWFGLGWVKQFGNENYLLKVLRKRFCLMITISSGIQIEFSDIWNVNYSLRLAEQIWNKYLFNLNFHIIQSSILTTNNFCLEPKISANHNYRSHDPSPNIFFQKRVAYRRQK